MPAVIFVIKVLITIILVLMAITITNAQVLRLDAHFYNDSCPQAEDIIRETLINSIARDPKVPPRILRMFFHDCFIRGCDASILLDSTRENKTEKDGPPNISVRAFYVIDNAKAKLEMACPRTVSCADIVAIAARDVVALSGGPHWHVLKGRKDGRVSNANETVNLPAPTFNLTQLINSFSQKGLGINDLVALSGGHTVGFSHCSSFESRISNFSPQNNIDPSMDMEFAKDLIKNKCPKTNQVHDNNAGQFLDSTPSTFDNVYYKQVKAAKGLFGSDQTLYGDFRTKRMVDSYADDQNLFFRDFASSMVKLGNVGVKENRGEVRLNCRFVN
ncbi:peroxidase 66 [Impatiens glandulifera]|uniref:peroxidase 66 n=1 Tax=Impatiens glandulifera TaxID=253017 RepID=UPI001FB19E71|nr:peroxidase 66 [Impatiens glandulifera]